MDIRNTNWREAGYSEEELISLTGVFGFRSFKSIFKKEISGTKDKINLSLRTGPVLIISDFYPSKKIIRNVSIISTEPGKHIGYNIFSSQVRYASQMGLNKILCEAFGNNKSECVGYIVWGKLGFVMTKQEDIDFFNQKLSQFHNETNHSRQNIKRFDQLLEDLEGGKFWKFHGRPWHGEFNLSHNSESMKILEHYKESRGL